ncbi:MAG: glycosyltransferase family 2 protein [Bacteroidales bacterium]|nr:glycosyltransferase family 2 protein [Bacteroidales bacterium]
MKIFAIIVAYNGMQWYKKCFDSIAGADIPISIVVIDNNSTDGTPGYIKQHYPHIKLFEFKENLGFARGNNIGLRYALDNNADYVLLLNQDAWLNEKNTISGLIAILENHPEFGILSPLQLYAGMNKIEQEVLMHFARQAKTANDFFSDLYFNRVKDVYEVPFACAACWLMPIKTIRALGGFDPLFFHYGEDDNYIHRLKYFGFKIGICPKLGYSHDIGTRVDKYREKHLDWKKFLLLNLANINTPINCNAIILKKVKTLFIQALRLNLKLLKKSVPEFLYLLKIRKPLMHSINKNKTIQTNWL